MKILDNITHKAKEIAGGVQKAADKTIGDIIASAKELSAWAQTMPDKLKKMAKDFDATAMWDKLSNTASKAGQDLIVKVLTIFYAIESKIPGSLKTDIKNCNADTLKDIAILLGAIVYFVSPVDLIPDMAPFGFIDDTAILTMAFNSAKSLFNSSDIARANAMAAKLLGDNFDPEKAAKITKLILNAKKR